MVSSALEAASLAPLVKKQYLADSVKKYKPCPEIYRGLLEFVGKADNASAVWLVSGYVGVPTPSSDSLTIP